MTNFSRADEPIDNTAGRLAGTNRTSSGASPEVKAAVIAEIVRQARAIGWSDNRIAIALAIAGNESGFNPDAATRDTASSASGVYQFIRETGIFYGLSPADAFDASKNIEAGLKMIAVEFTKAAALAGDTRFDTMQPVELVYAFHHEGTGAPADSVYKYLSNQKVDSKGNSTYPSQFRDKLIGRKIVVEEALSGDIQGVVTAATGRAYLGVIPSASGVAPISVYLDQSLDPNEPGRSTVLFANGAVIDPVQSVSVSLASGGYAVTLTHTYAGGFKIDATYGRAGVLAGAVVTLPDETQIQVNSLTQIQVGPGGRSIFVDGGGINFYFKNDLNINAPRQTYVIQNADTGVGILKVISGTVANPSVLRRDIAEGSTGKFNTDGSFSVSSNGTVSNLGGTRFSLADSGNPTSAELGYQFRAGPLPNTTAFIAERNVDGHVARVTSVDGTITLNIGRGDVVETLSNGRYLQVDKSHPNGATISRPNGASRRGGFSGFGRGDF